MRGGAGEVGLGDETHVPTARHRSIDDLLTDLHLAEARYSASEIDAPLAACAVQ